jgi:Amt family ammonium transporter
MLLSAALVLILTGPGLVLYYGGSPGRKQMLRTLMTVAVVAVLWIWYGFRLTFGGGQWFILVYQLALAAIGPALIAGALGDRMKLQSLLLFTALWLTFVYVPMAHMVWGKPVVPILDFGGGAVAQITSGVAALVCAWYLSRLGGSSQDAWRPHSPAIAVVGACMVWAGWFGIATGSAISASLPATKVLPAVQLAAAGGALGWILVEWNVSGGPTLEGAILGLVSGLAAATPAAGFVTPLSALWIGVVTGVLCCFASNWLGREYGHDRALHAFTAHGWGGTLGVVLTGVLATSTVNGTLKNARGAMRPLGLVDGNPRQMLSQLLGVLIAWTLSAAGTLVILKIVDVTVGLRPADAAAAAQKAMA